MAVQAPTRIELDDMGSYVLVEDEQDRVMPTVTAVKSAGRYSLHQAISMHGGYAAVAEALDRSPCWPRHPHLREDPAALRDELVDVALREGLDRGTMPTLAMLREAGRSDLHGAVIGLGSNPRPFPVVEYIWYAFGILHLVCLVCVWHLVFNMLGMYLAFGVGYVWLAA